MYLPLSLVSVPNMRSTFDASSINLTTAIFVRDFMHMDLSSSHPSRDERESRCACFLCLTSGAKEGAA